MKEDPEQPGEKPGDSEAEKVADGGSATDRGHDAVVAVMERLERFPSNGARDVARGVRALLDGHLGHAGQGRAVLGEGTEIADDEKRRMAGHLQRGFGRDTAGTIERHADRFCERRRRHAGRPQHRVGIGSLRRALARWA